MSKYENAMYYIFMTLGYVTVSFGAFMFNVVFGMFLTGFLLIATAITLKESKNEKDLIQPKTMYVGENLPLEITPMPRDVHERQTGKPTKPAKD